MLAVTTRIWLYDFVDLYLLLMTYIDGALFGLFGCLLFQLVVIHNYRDTYRKWPWQDKKNKMTIGFFAFGLVSKAVIAASLTAMMVYTNQISGPWAAFLIGMSAERIIIVLADKALKGVTK